MGLKSAAIDALVAFNIISGRKNTAANVRAVFAGVSDAISFLEGLQRGATILQGTTAPTGADGIDGDAYILTTTSDFYLRDATNGWALQFRLKGQDGKTPKKGTDYFDGKTPVKGTDYFDGKDGKSAYQLWQADSSANTGSVTQWLASLVGKPGDPGQRGNVNQWRSYAPTNEAGLPGDAWFHTISATKMAVYECVTSGTWGLRFTSPDPAASTTVATGSNYTLPVASAAALGGVKSAGTGLAGNVVVNGDGSMTAPAGGANYPAQSNATINQSLRSNGTPGGEYWGGIIKGCVLRFLNAEVQEPQRFFRAATITRIEKDAGVASVSYAVNGAAAQVVAFTNDVWTGSLAIPAKAAVVWSITYQSGYNEGNFEIIFTE